MRLSSLAWRNLAARRARTLLTTAGVALGVAVILATSIANASTVSAFGVMIDSITGKADFLINGASSGGFDEDRLELVRRVAGVADAVPGISKQTSLIIKGDTQDVRFAGIDPRIDRKLRKYTLKNGRWLRPSEAGALIPEQFAQEHSLVLGDKVAVAERGRRHTFKVVGLLKNEGAGRFMGGRVVFIPLERAQKVFQLEGQLTFMDVRVEEGRSVGAVSRAVAGRLGDRFTIERPEKRSEAISQMLRGLRVGLSFFGAIAMFVGGFLVYNTFAMVVLEQTRELGIIRSMGATRAQITALILTQAAVVGVIGSIIGLVGGVGLARFLLLFVSDTVQLPIRDLSVPPVGLIVAIAVGLLVTLAAAAQPAIMAGKVSPLAAIRIRGRESSGRLGLLRVLAGVAVVGLGAYVSFMPGGRELGRLAPWSVPIHAGGDFCLLLGAALLSPSFIAPLGYILAQPARVIFGETGKLAAANLRRNRGRTAATASAIMITLAMLLSVGGMTISFRQSVEEWVDKSMGADVYVSGPSTDVTYDKSYAGKLRRIEGVSDMTVVGYTSVRAGDANVLWRAIEPQSYRRFASMQVVEGRKDAAWKKLRRQRHVFISTVMANSRDLSVGDRVTVATKEGKTQFTVAGVIVDFGGEMGELMVGSRRDFKKYFGITDISAFRLKVEPGAEPAVVAGRIERKFKNMNFNVNDVQEFKEMVDEQVNKSFAVFTVLILLAAIVAMISVFNTLMMNILERRREIGVLRAVGATRGQIGLISLIEAGITGAIGGLFGLIVGGYLAADIVKNMRSLTGYEISFVFPAETTAVALVVALLFSVVAAAYPARRAASLNISQAIQYE